MNKRLKRLLESTQMGGVKQTCLLDTYNQTIYTDIAPTISTRVDASSNTYIMEVIPLNPYNDGTARTIKAQYQQSSMAKRRGRVQEGGKVTPTICTSNELSVYEGVENQEYRIRKLTPRECFRLMGVSEEDIDKIQAAGISNAQQYKMAGNSIVVDVLYHIFRKMFVDKESDNAELTLF